MERFYRNRVELAATPALSEAKQWLRAYADSAGNRLYAHPAYWAAFVLLGAD